MTLSHTLDVIVSRVIMDNSRFIPRANRTTRVYRLIRDFTGALNDDKIRRQMMNGCIDRRHWFHTIIVVLQATRWITKAAGRFTSGWMMCLFMAPRRRSRARASRARKSSRVSWRINFRLCSSRRTTSWLWSSSAARRRLWKNESGKKPQVTGSSILAPVFGKSSAYQLISFNRHQYFALSHSFRLENTSY